MQSSQIRKEFIEFFKQRDHTVVPSSSLLPDDPSVLLTSAGMQQFKPYYTGDIDPMTSTHPTLGGKPIGSKNATSSQKSFRTVDIDEVGDDSHLTFFEMLGNFSFGGYGKKESIEWAYEFITKTMEINISYVTIFHGSSVVPKDIESIDIWKSLGVSDIREEGMEDLFWGPTGNKGPCGPTTEIYCKNAKGQDVEIWNIVFNQYFFPGTRDELLKGDSGKKLEELPFLGVDTGMGFERLVMIKQNKKNVFDTDLFIPLLEIINQNTKKPNEKSARIISDHIRGSVFLMGDGVRPSNVEQGYILRRVIRKAIRHVSLLELSDGVFVQLINKIIELYKDVYPELRKEKNNILTAFDSEKAKFEKTLEKGLKEFEKLKTITGEQAFHLYDTYGFPLELTKELAKEKNININEDEFNDAFGKHQETSRAGLEGKFGGHGLLVDTGELKAGNEEELKKVTRLHTATHLLHKALREVLGTHVQQRGSDITPERLRFDFVHPEKMTDEEKKKVEDLVNEKIHEDLKVVREETTYDEAIQKGALAFFKEKYPEKVSMYSVGGFSKEICGGPHVEHTGEIGSFKIKKEMSSSAGIRRIKAIVE